MPTPKQTRKHYKKCRRYFYLLLKALNEAHSKRVINYGPSIKGADGFYRDTFPSVCDAVYEAKENFEKSTAQARANALRDEVLKELKGVY